MKNNTEVKRTKKHEICRPSFSKHTRLRQLDHCCLFLKYIGPHAAAVTAENDFVIIASGLELRSFKLQYAARREKDQPATFWPAL